MNEQPTSWDDVDVLLEAMGRIDLELALIDTDYGTRLMDLLSEYRDRVAGPAAERRGIEEAVREFCGRHKAEFAKKRSRQLYYGKVGYRVAERIAIPKGKEDIVVKTLLALGLTECLRTTVRPDLEAMRKLTDADLARCGARREKTDHFKIEPNLEAVAKKTGKAIDLGARPAIDLGKLAGAIGDRAA